MSVFNSGRSGNPKGRPKGAISKPHAEVRRLAVRLFDPEYWALKYKELHTGTCHPKIESTLLTYAFGLPIREVHATGTIVHLGPLQALQQQLDEAQDTEPSLDIEAFPQPASDSEPRP